MTSTREIGADPATMEAVPSSRPRRDATNVGLRIPRELWSPPVSEAVWRGVWPRLSKLLLLAPAVALVAAYVSAVAAAHGHLTASEWLLGLAVCSVLTGAIALAVHGRRLAPFHAEMPCESLRCDRGDVGGEGR